MKKLKKVTLAAILTLALGSHAMAGIIQTPGPPPPPPDTSSTITSGPASSAGTIETPPTSSESLVVVAVELLQTFCRCSNSPNHCQALQPQLPGLAA